MSTRAVIIIIGMMFLTAGIADYCYPEDGSDAGATMTMYGRVTSVDWVGSVFAVSEAQFFVSPDTEVIKGTSKIGFTDVSVGDRVAVAYTREKDGSLKAVRVVVAYSGEFPS